jgi:hypothetical protein
MVLDLPFSILLFHQLRLVITNFRQHEILSPEWWNW